MGNNTSSNPELSHFPPEITAAIFDFACDDHRQHVHNAMNDVYGDYMARYEKENGGGRITGPVTLSQVCRAWKDFVYCTPVLWDTVFVYIPQEDRFGSGTIVWLNRAMSPNHRDPTFEDAAMKLTRWLDRSANCPVTVKIEGGPGGPYVPVLFQPLLTCSERWKDIDIFCLEDHGELYSRMEQVKKGPLPLLESFICRENRCVYSGPRVHPTLSLEAAKKLTKITQFRYVPLSFSRRKIEVGRWCEFTTSEIIDDLAVMNNIRECAVYDVQEPEDTRRVISPLRLSHLEKLDLHDLTEIACDSLLPFLELPFLRQFTFSNSYRPRTKATARPIQVVDHSKGGMDILPLLLSLLLRSSPPCLQSLNLRIYANTVRADILLDILRLSPTLQHVDIALLGFHSRDTLASVSVGEDTFADDSVVLESLTSYYLNMASLDSDSEEHTALLKYLTLPALKDFRVVFPRQKTPSPVETLQIAYFEVENLLDRSNCSLKTLKLETHADISETNLLNLLTKLPTLECLQLAGYLYDVGRGYSHTVPNEVKFVVRSGLFELLLRPSRSSASTVYLPNLREMILTGIFAADLEEVFSALEFRWTGDENRGIQRLTRVGIYYTQESIKALKEKSLQRYEDLRLQGMDVVFRKQS